MADTSAQATGRPHIVDRTYAVDADGFYALPVERLEDMGDD